MRIMFTTNSRKGNQMFVLLGVSFQGKLLINLASCVPHPITKGIVTYRDYPLGLIKNFEHGRTQLPCSEYNRENPI